MWRGFAFSDDRDSFQVQLLATLTGSLLWTSGSLTVTDDVGLAFYWWWEP
jgi:hypothetical protein